VRGYLRLLHTSDLHLGAVGRGREDGLQALEAVLEATVATRADLLLLCGDIFDNNRLRDDFVAAALRLLAQAPVPTIVLPGNHDCHGEGSVYARVEAMGLPSNLFVLAPGREQVSFPALEVAVWGRPHVSYRDMRPLHHPPPRGRERWQIAMAHGHLVREPWDLQRSYLIFPREIAESGRDYVALGHWELPYEASAGEVVAAYSGSPHLARQVLLVELGRDIRLRPYPL